MLAVHAGHSWVDLRVSTISAGGAAALELGAEPSLLQPNLFSLDRFVEASRMDLNLALVESPVFTLTKNLARMNQRPGKNRIIQV
jgi:hypothetical protein